MASSSSRSSKKKKVQVFWDPPVFQGVTIDYPSIYRRYSDRTIISGRSVSANYSACGFQVHADHLGLILFFGIDEDVHPDIVRYFYTNMRILDEFSFSTFVKGEEILVTPDIVREALDLPMADLKLFNKRLEVAFPNPDYDAIYAPGCPKDNQHNSLKGGAKMFHKFSNSNILTKMGNFDRVSENDVTLCYSFITETPFDISDIIFKRMLEVNSLRHLPYGMYITRILKHLGMNLEDEEVEDKQNPLNRKTLSSMGVPFDAPIDYHPPVPGAPPVVPPVVPPPHPDDILRRIEQIQGEVHELKRGQNKLSRLVKRLLRNLGCSTSSSSSD